MFFSVLPRRSLLCGDEYLQNEFTAETQRSPSWRRDETLIITQPVFQQPARRELLTSTAAKLPMVGPPATAVGTDCSTFNSRSQFDLTESGATESVFRDTDAFE